MKFLNDLKILLHSRKIGEDQFGNCYYEEKRKSKGIRKKRYVRYNGLVESSKIPPMWHAWLHYIDDKIPSKKRKLFEWQKSHEPNLTGTIYAKKPKGSLSQAGLRQKSSADYESWKPKNK